MSEKSSVTVTIYGNEYTLKGDADPAYIEKLARFLDRKMEEIGRKSSAPVAKVAILAGMNIADELHRLEKSRDETKRLLEAAERQLEELRSSSDGATKHVLALKEELEAARTLGEEHRQAAERARREAEEARREAQSRKADLEKLLAESQAKADRIRELETCAAEAENLRREMEELAASRAEAEGKMRRLEEELAKKTAEADRLREEWEALRKAPPPAPAFPRERLTALFKRIDAVLD